MRHVLCLAAVLAASLALPCVAAAPQVGYAGAQHEATVARGGTTSYTFTLLLEPSAGDEAVDLQVSFRDMAPAPGRSIAPPTLVEGRALSSSSFSTWGTLSGYDEVLHRPGIAGGQHELRITSTVPQATPLGEHRSYLGVRALDPQSATSTATAVYEFTLQVLAGANPPPVAEFSFNAIGLEVEFDASASSDADDEPLTYAWEFGDGSTGLGVTVEHTFDEAGVFNVRLAVHDGTSEGTRIKAVDLSVPTATLPVPTVDQPPTTIDADGDGFSDGEEQSAKSDPADPKSTPVDRDGDGFTGAQETQAGSDPLNPKSTPLDRDGDGWKNEADNCPAFSNPSQADADKDGSGDGCDPIASDGPGGDSDGDGKVNGQDRCPGKPDTGADLDGDKIEDACDPDRDGDGAVNELDAFPDKPLEAVDTDADGLGDGADEDDDGDGLLDIHEDLISSDRSDRFDPPWKAERVFAVPLSNDSALVAWTVPTDDRVARYLLWREAASMALVTAFDAGSQTYRYSDSNRGEGPVRYHVQTQFKGPASLLFQSQDAISSNRIQGDAVLIEGCAPGAADLDRDGLCDILEREWGLDFRLSDTDADGILDGDEADSPIGRATIPILADSDGDGASDARELDGGSDPLDIAQVPAAESKGAPLAGGTALAALVLAVFRRRSLHQPPRTQ